MNSQITHILQNILKNPSATPHLGLDELTEPEIDQVVEALIKLFYHTDSAVRSRAVLTCGQLKAEAAISPLIDIVCNDRDLNVREDAVWAIARVGKSAITALVSLLDDTDRLIRVRVVHALGKIKDPGTLSDLLRVLQDESPGVRYKTTVALSQLGDPAAIEALIEALADEHPDVSAGALTALHSFGVSAIEPLINAMSHPLWYVRDMVANALGDIGDLRAVPVLLSALDDEAWEVRFSTVIALGQIGDVRAIPALARAQDDPNPRVRMAARNALQHMPMI